MNYEQINLDPLVVPHDLLTDYLQCIAHTIVFNRALGTCTPIDVDIDRLKISYIRTDNPRVLKTVEDRIKSFADEILKAMPSASKRTGSNTDATPPKARTTGSGGLSSGSNPDSDSDTQSSMDASMLEELQKISSTLTVTFYEVRVKKGLIRNSEEKITWEQWAIPVAVDPSGRSWAEWRDKEKTRLSDEVAKRMQNVLSFVSQKSEHIPSLSTINEKTNAFNFELTGKHPNSKDTENGSVSRMLKWMMKSSDL